MNQQLELNEYKQQIADLYSRRGQTYDEGDWHPRIAHRLVEHAHISQGQHILDIATGTGMVAIEAAQLVGFAGRVVGVDISTGMLEQAKRKIEALGLNNIELVLADAEKLNFPANSFDVVLCSSALIWMANVPAALRLWHQFLKPNGLIGFHAFADTAFVEGVTVQKVAEKYGVSLAFSKPTGTIEKCHELLKTAGFEVIEIKSEQDGSYISLEQAKRMWSGSSHPVPGQFPNPLSQLSSEQLKEVKAEFEAELAALVTEQGIWNDMTIFYTFGRKPRLTSP
ncbi:class I SAM-dependent methyltransferase [Nostoc sp. TCL240-02]|uniref:class I SAM-dependent methyltransferase n=1 Tax=Nostoc sp. TCL240-02 TaxID=2572090 RepID=UPI00157F9541|nr:methyltransferase domain-containing protein [Nostoc sp. TCL240-02]QKQ76627.1 methyltransferase domain-containing protein [Nostoc sp. TCL240-02]